LAGASAGFFSTAGFSSSADSSTTIDGAIWSLTGPLMILSLSFCSSVTLIWEVDLRASNAAIE